MKVVLEIRGEITPKNNDVLVFDAVNECWKIIPKNEFLKEIKEEFKGIKEEFKKTQNKCVEMQEDLQAMAKIMKEGME